MIETANVSREPSAWIVVITKQGQERNVRERLMDQGFDVYLPMRLVKSVKRGSYPTPFFPGYLFARITMEAKRWQAIFSTVGVARVLCSPEQPFGVRDELIERIRRKEINGLLRLGVREGDYVPPPAKFEKGQQVTTLDGVVEAVFQEPIDGRRGLLLASFFNSDAVKVTVDLRKLATKEAA